jgi:hypothetical protein
MLRGVKRGAVAWGTIGDRLQESRASWYAKVAVVALTGAWSTAFLHAKLVVEPAVHLIGADVLALYVGTPSALLAFPVLSACLRRRRWSTAVPFLFGCAWLPILVCAAFDPATHDGFVLLGWGASFGGFLAGAACVALPMWSGFGLPRRRKQVPPEGARRAIGDVNG